MNRRIRSLSKIPAVDSGGRGSSDGVEEMRDASPLPGVARIESSNAEVTSSIPRSPPGSNVPFCMSRLGATRVPGVGTGF